MKPAHTVEEFLANPLGQYTVGSTHLVWCHSATLCGTAHWGRPSEADAAGLVQRLELSLHPALAGGFDAFMDARAMESFEWPAFGVVSEYVKSRLAEWSRRIRRHAVVVPPGVVGVFVAGLMPLVGPSHQLRFFPNAAAALDWLDNPALPDVLAEVSQLVEQACGVAPLVRALRAHLDQALADASLDSTAHALGLSTRSLQRELQRHGTRFTVELTQARVRAACIMLEHSDEKIEAIARRVGCVSSSQLSVIFRQVLGETPAKYRARRVPSGSW